MCVMFLIITGLEYKFMVKSVDPDGTTAVTDNKNEPDDVVMSLSHDLQEGVEEVVEQVEEEEMTSPTPAIHSEEGMQPNSTGKNHARTCPSRVQAPGQIHRCQ